MRLNSAQRNFFGIYKKIGVARIERNFDKEFGLEVENKQLNKIKYKPGYTKEYKRLEQENLNYLEWNSKLVDWWKAKSTGVITENFSGLYDTKLTMLHVKTYKDLTGEMIPSEIIKDSYKIIR